MMPEYKTHFDSEFETLSQELGSSQLTVSEDTSDTSDAQETGDVETSATDETGGEENADAHQDALSDEELRDLLSDLISAVKDGESEDAESSSADSASEASSDSEDQADAVSGEEASAPSVTRYLIDIDGEPVSVTVTALDDVDIMPLSVVPSTMSYTPQAFQVNLAENRAFGEHYLMWAQRVTSGSSYYLRYYLALGSKISFDGSTYRYTDAEVYTYYNYNSSVTYDVSVSSGSLSGSSYLVYSDLYFDYVGVDPAFKGSVYIFFALFMIMIALLVIGGKRNV